MRACRFTSVIRKARGSAAPTRTPTDCCDSTSRKAPTSACIAPRRSSPWPRPSMPGPERRSTGKRPQRRLTSGFLRPTNTVLRRSFESAQYCSIDYQAALRKHGILISMSGKGNCYDNAMVETFFKTLKSELVWRAVFYTRQQADQAIGRYIDGFYNPVRRHSALDFTSPAQFEKSAAE